MTLSFPLSASALADLLPIRSVKWWLNDNQELSGLGSGQVLGADLGPRLWSGDVGLSAMTHAQAAGVQSRIESLDGVLRDFYLYAPQRQYPQADPLGSALGSATPTIGSATGNSVAFDDLPAGYVLTFGDFFAFDYGSPSRRAFHRICETGAADGSGATAALEVRPEIRLPDYIAGTPVTLIKPAARVFILPNSFDPGTARIDGFTEGMSFQVMQRLV